MRLILSARSGDTSFFRDATGIAYANRVKKWISNDHFNRFSQKHLLLNGEN
jgi:hypothetical protein